MGWTSITGTPRKFMERLAHDCNTNAALSLLSMKATCFGKHIWLALENRTTKQKFIVLYLMEKNKDAWYYKDMDEDMGFYAVDCPLELLEITSPGTGTEYSMKWRQGVKVYHERKTRKFNIGDVVKVGSTYYKIAEKQKRKKSYIITDSLGNRYKCTPEKMHKPENAIDFIANAS